MDKIVSHKWLILLVLLMVGGLYAIVAVMKQAQSSTQRNFQSISVVAAQTPATSLSFDSDLVEFELCELRVGFGRNEMYGLVANDAGIGRTDMRFLMGIRVGMESDGPQVILCATYPSIYPSIYNKQKSYILARRLKIEGKGKQDIWIVPRTD